MDKLSGNYENKILNVLKKVMIAVPDGNKFVVGYKQDRAKIDELQGSKMNLYGSYNSCANKSMNLKNMAPKQIAVPVVTAKGVSGAEQTVFDMRVAYRGKNSKPYHPFYYEVPSTDNKGFVFDGDQMFYDKVLSSIAHALAEEHKNDPFNQKAIFLGELKKVNAMEIMDLSTCASPFFHSGSDFGKSDKVIMVGYDVVFYAFDAKEKSAKQALDTHNRMIQNTKAQAKESTPHSKA